MESTGQLHTVSVTEFEDLQRKYDQNQKQYEDLKQILEQREKEMQKLENMIEPALDQYSQLELKYEIEKGCRNKAEDFAREITDQNKQLKRQSQLLIQKVQVVDINIDELEDIFQEEEESEPSAQATEHYDQQIEVLKEELATVKHALKKAEETCEEATKREEIVAAKYQHELEAHSQTQQGLKQHQSQMNKLNRVSLNAYKEFEDLRSKYDEKVALQTEAEKYASKMKTAHDVMKRESSVLIASAATNERLHGALMEIETLTTQMDEQRMESKQRIDELEQQLAESQVSAQISDLEKSLQIAVDQLDELRRQMAENDKYKKKLEKEIQELTTNLEAALHPPPPPPPPPPPAPPMPAGGFFNPLRLIMKTKKKSATITPGTRGRIQSEEQVNYDMAIKEMMDRIQKGTWKGSNRRPSLPETESPVAEAGAMEEMHDMIKNLRRSRSTNDMADGSSFANDDHELSKVFRQVTGKERDWSADQMATRPQLSVITESEEGQLSPMTSSSDL